jgi:hypothetical protein
MNYYKALAGILFLTVVSFVTGCDKIDDLLTFTITDQTTIRIENNSPLNLPFEIATPDISTNANQEFQNNNTKADLVKDIKLEEVKLTITSPNGKTFSFIKSIHIYVATTTSDEIQLAFADNIEANTNTINLTCTKEKLDRYIKSDSYKLRTEIVTRETLTQSIDIQANLKFKVTAEAL